MICAVNERSTEDILLFEHMNGILETDDRLRSPSLQRWRLVDVFLMTDYI